MRRIVRKADFIPLLVIDEKKLQNLFTGRPHNSTFTAYNYDFSQQSYHLIPVKAIKINWELGIGE